MTTLQHSPPDSDGSAPSDDVTAAVDFLSRAIVPDGQGVIALRHGIDPMYGAVRPNVKTYFGADAVSDAAEWIVATGATQDVYVSSAPRASEDSTKAAILHCHVAVADVDSEQAHERMDALPEPTFTVRSGGGEFNYHAYWRLTSPVGAAELEEITKRIDAHLSPNREQHVYDAGHIFRIPGTVAHKYSGTDAEGVEHVDPRPIEYRSDSGATYDYPGLLDPVKALVPEVAGGKSNGKAGSNGSGRERKAFSGKTHEGENRGLKLCELAGRLKAMGIVDEEALGDLLLYNDRHCDPPYDEAKVQAIARRYASSATDGEADEGALPASIGDEGNAALYARENKGRVLFCGALGWHHWSGKVWQPDVSQLRYAYTRHVRRELYRQAQCATTVEQSEKLTKRANSLCEIGKKKAAVDLALPDMFIEESRLDSGNTLNTQTGILNLDTLELSPHDPSRYHTKLTSAGYDPDAKSPRWNRFLEEVQPDSDMREFLQLACGSMLQNTFSNFFLILYESGRNGKSKFCEAIAGALGDYASTANAELLFTSSQHGVSAAELSELADMRGQRMVVSGELPNGMELNEPFVLRATGDSTFKAKKMHRDMFEFKNASSLIMMTNHKPKIPSQTVAMWERIKLVPFSQRFLQGAPGWEEDGHLLGALRAEQDGILRWLVDGLRKFEAGARQLPTPDAVRHATAEYREESDTFAAFFNLVVELVPAGTSREGWEPWNAIWTAYQDAVAFGGAPKKDPNELTAALLANGASAKTRKGGGKGVRGWQGVCLRDDRPQKPTSRRL